MTPRDFIAAARVPRSIEPQKFGLWEIERRQLWQAIEPIGDWGDDPGIREGLERIAQMRLGHFPDYTLLWRVTLASMHRERGEIVMEDSQRELRKHLPIWLVARGRVLKTGLGLGCVVRGLLIKPEVEHVDVVEIDPDICRIIGAEFEGNPRVSIHLADALTWDFGDRRWDFAWHDLHAFEERPLQLMHAELLARYMPAVKTITGQGAWAFPRDVARTLPFRLLGAPRT